MVFSAIPVYLDPHNWPQQNIPQPGAASENTQLPPLPPPAGGGGTGSIRPGSMADRSSLAKIPQPEAGLKCPRCESTNTKFCYFNNYSLSQPRHFCKTCRRYWTRGGALRNVPVGGGCRRNKRSKGRNNRSKSQVKHGSTSNTGLGADSCTTDIIGHMPSPPPQPLPIVPSLHHVDDYNSIGIGLNFSGFRPPVEATDGGGGNMEFHHIGNTTSISGGGGGGSILSSGLDERWRLQQVQQFPLLSNLEPPANGFFHQFDQGNGIDHQPPNYARQLRSRALDTAVTQSSSVKIEENQGLNFSRNFLGISGNDQYWGGNAWTDLPGFTSSSTGHLL